MDQQISESIKQGQEGRARLVRHIKEYALAIVSTGLLVLDWWFLRQSLFGGAPASFWFWPAVVTAFWVTSAAFFALVNPDKITFFIFNALGLVSFLVIMPKDLYVFIGGMIFFLLSMQFQHQVQQEERSHLNFSIRRTIGNSQNIIVYGLLVMLGFMIYSNINADFRRDPNTFYRNLGEAAVKSVPYLSQDRSKYNLNLTVREFFRREAIEQYPDFNQVSAEQQDILMEQIREQFNQQFGVSADPNMSLRAAMVEVVTQRIRETLGRFERFFPLFFTVLLIALMRTLSFVFNWVVLFISWVFYRLLKALRFFKITKETVEIEKLDI